jgi:F-type H+-transporting ATPase subunit gamma
VAGGQERALRRRIRTIQSTRKIMKAVELIAASQIVRSLTRMTANRPYREGMARIVVEAAKGDPTAAAKLLGEPESRSAVAVLVIAGDRGLAGAYNSSVLRATERLTANLRGEGIETRLYTVGRKAPAYFRFRHQPVERSFTGMSERPTWAYARTVAAAVTAPFLAGEVDQVLLVSTRYRSAGRQVVETRQLLPLPEPETPSATGSTEGPTGYTEFEPDVETLLAQLAPRAVESEIFTALLEGAASFFTAQQRAMAAATDNADELVRTLTRIMNRARQDAITTEIMEIVGGAEALRQQKGA